MGREKMIDVDSTWEAFIAILLAVAGGFARILNLKDNVKMKWSLIFSELFISGFAGLMVLLLARASGLSGEWIGVAAGISGWLGTRVLDVIAHAVGKAVGVDVDSTRK